MRGNMPLKCVKGIHSGTRITSFDDLFDVVRQYKLTYWDEFNDDDIFKVLNGIFFGNKIFYQVRLKPNKTKKFSTWTRV